MKKRDRKVLKPVQRINQVFPTFLFGVYLVVIHADTMIDPVFTGKEIRRNQK